MNDNVILVSGFSKTGKSASLINLNDPTGVMYLNAEDKRLPFKSEFMEFTITDPLQVYEAFVHAETLPDVHTIIIDSLTFLMDMYESLYVIPSTNTMKSWSDFAQYFKNLRQQYVAKSTKNVIFLAHLEDIFNETEMIMQTKVPIKGALKKNGIESYFTDVISTKKITLKDLKISEHS